MISLYKTYTQNEKQLSSSFIHSKHKLPFPSMNLRHGKEGIHMGVKKEHMATSTGLIYKPAKRDLGGWGDKLGLEID